MADDLPSGKEFFEAARKELGYEKNLLCDEGRTYEGRETDGEYSLEVKFNAGLDILSQKLALECGQAREIAPGVIKYKSREPERFLTPEEREIERQEFGPCYTPKTLHRIVMEGNRERQYCLELAREFRQASEALQIGLVQESKDYER